MSPGGSDEDDGDLFRRVVADARPLKRRRPLAGRAAPAGKPKAPGKAPAPKPPARTTRAAPSAPLPRPAKPLATGDTSAMDRRTADRFRRGKLPIEGRLDLHGMFQDAAHSALNAFILDSAAAGKRMVLVITGRGSRAGSGVLRDRLPQWLNQPPCRDHVLAFTTARPQHGREGAFYVLLKRKRDRGA